MDKYDNIVVRYNQQLVQMAFGDIILSCSISFTYILPTVACRFCGSTVENFDELFNMWVLELAQYHVKSHHL